MTIWLQLSSPSNSRKTNSEKNVPKRDFKSGPPQPQSRTFNTLDHSPMKANLLIQNFGQFYCLSVHSALNKETTLTAWFGCYNPALLSGFLATINISVNITHACLSSLQRSLWIFSFYLFPTKIELFWTAQNLRI